MSWLVAGLGEDSVFGYAFLPGILSLVIWSIAASIAEYRAVSLLPGGRNSHGQAG